MDASKNSMLSFRHDISPSRFVAFQNSSFRLGPVICPALKIVMSASLQC